MGLAALVEVCALLSAILVANIDNALSVNYKENCYMCGMSASVVDNR